MAFGNDPVINAPSDLSTTTCHRVALLAGQKRHPLRIQLTSPPRRRRGFILRILGTQEPLLSRSHYIGMEILIVRKGSFHTMGISIWVGRDLHCERSAIGFHTQYYCCMLCFMVLKTSSYGLLRYLLAMIRCLSHIIQIAYLCCEDIKEYQKVLPKKCNLFKSSMLIKIMFEISVNWNKYLMCSSFEFCNCNFKCLLGQK